MAAKRPIVMEAFKQVLVAGVPLASSRVYLPWDDIPEIREVGSYLQIMIQPSEIDDTESIGTWMHRLPLVVSAIRAGAFDYPAVWEMLHQAAQALVAAGALGGLAQRVDVTGTGDEIEVAGDKLLLPHIAVEITYLTPQGSL